MWRTGGYCFDVDLRYAESLRVSRKVPPPSLPSSLVALPHSLSSFPSVLLPYPSSSFEIGSHVA